MAPQAVRLAGEAEGPKGEGQDGPGLLGGRTDSATACSSSRSSSSRSLDGEDGGSEPWQLWCVLVTSATAMPPEEQLSMAMSTAKSIKQRTRGTSIRFAVVCDGHKGPEEGRTVDKRGRVGPLVAEQYTAYKSLLRKETLFERVLEMDEHIGFGHCVAQGARQFVTTEYMLVAQHDYMFVTDVDMGMVREALEKGAARYVVFAFGQMVNRALKLAKREHGPARPRDPCLLVFDKYHDKNHVIGRDVYLNEVIPHVRRGQFPEDVFSQSQMKLDPQWYRTFGICLYCDPTIEFGVLAHLKGRQTKGEGEISRRIGRLRMTAPADGEEPDLAVVAA